MSNEKSSSESLLPTNRWRHDISTQDEGEVHFVYRQPQTLDSLLELEAWMVMTLHKIRSEFIRRDGKAGHSATETP